MLFQEIGDKPEELVKRYAAMEARGEVRRKSDARKVDPLDYARRLYADAKRKGWLV